MITVVDPNISDSYEHTVRGVALGVEQLAESLLPVNVVSKTSTVTPENAAKVDPETSNAPGGGGKLEGDACSCKEEVEAKNPNEHRQVEVPKWKLVPALIVIGGMDTTGHLHSDTFVYVPKFVA